MPEVEVNETTSGVESSTEQCSPDTTQNEETEVANAKTEDEPQEEDQDKKEDEWLDILGSGQLKMKVIRKGEPDTRPQPSDICNIKYSGKLDDGTIVEEYNSLRIQLGDHEVIQGLELAIPLMNVGEESIIVVGPRFAYGSIGLNPDIPPDATITYTVELLKVDEEPDLEKVPYDKRKIMANSKREKGNWWYCRQDATKAIQCYRKALDLLDDTIPYTDEDGKIVEGTEEMIKDINEERLRVYNNLAQAQMTIGAYDSALTSAEIVLRFNPKNVKALFRKGKILNAKGQTNEAVEILRQAFLIDPENSAIKKELSRCVKTQQVEKQTEKNLYKKMLGQDRKDEKSSQSKTDKASSWTKIIGTAATATVMAAVAVAVGYRYKNFFFF